MIPLNDRQVSEELLYDSAERDVRTSSSSIYHDSSIGSTTPGGLELEERDAPLVAPHPSTDLRPRVSGRATLARRVTSLGDSMRSLKGDEPDTGLSEKDTQRNAGSSGRCQVGGTKRKKRVKYEGDIPSKSDLAWTRRFNELKGKSDQFFRSTARPTNSLTLGRVQETVWTHKCQANLRS